MYYLYSVSLTSDPISRDQLPQNSFWRDAKMARQSRAFCICLQRCAHCPRPKELLELREWAEARGEFDEAATIDFDLKALGIGSPANDNRP